MGVCVGVGGCSVGVGWGSAGRVGVGSAVRVGPGFGVPPGFCGRPGADALAPAEAAAEGDADASASFPSLPSPFFFPCLPPASVCGPWPTPPPEDAGPPSGASPAR
ncbi:hypothetical protein SZN_08951 [Streptomyces zinciresistens K42]|uniref:Uncharacterized protein n=1 Tax=Streptomyces zinciresistens K42 TaxID=700597 RepID=G2G8H6_9ACTN|nr:hypothetical protein SZN_08951 [Streptomyces zinciresistens K42]